MKQVALFFVFSINPSGSHTPPPQKQESFEISVDPDQTTPNNSFALNTIISVEIINKQPKG